MPDPTLTARLCRFALCWVVALALAASAQAQDAPSGFDHFVTADGPDLVDGDDPFRFISFNIPNLNFVEDEYGPGAPHEYRLPDEFELRDAFESVRQLGGTVIRLYTFPVRTEGDPPDLPRFVLGPGRFDERSFETMDLALALASEYGVRLVLPFVNNWQWMGGRPQMAAFRGLTEDDFWTDPQLIEDMEAVIRYVVHRRNTITGVVYRDDPAILAWETGNELQAPQAWTSRIAATIKREDPNHLVMDGFFATDGRPVHEEAVQDPNVDVLSSHHYPSDPAAFLADVDANRALIAGRKPYVIGEMGFLGTSAIERIYDHVIAADDVAGALMWSLRFHRREGGFYWHSEPLGNGVFKAYHWPGFDSGTAYDERALLDVQRRKAFEIRGLAVPPREVPHAPTMLPVERPAHVSWQGSAGAASYDVERAPSAGGPWTVVRVNVSDAVSPYAPLFNDDRAPLGVPLFYRVVARNVAGASAPSAPVGPVTFAFRTTVDEAASTTRAYHITGDVTLASGDDRTVGERTHRLSGAPGAELTYAVPGRVVGWTVHAYAAPDSGAAPARALAVSVSADGEAYADVPITTDAAAAGANDYGYWVPVTLRGEPPVGADARFVRLRFDARAQVDRVEVDYVPDSPTP